MNRLGNTFLQCSERKHLPYLAAFSNCLGHNRHILEHSVEKLENRNDHIFGGEQFLRQEMNHWEILGRSALAPLPLLLTKMSSLSRVFENKKIIPTALASPFGESWICPYELHWLVSHRGSHSIKFDWIGRQNSHKY